MPKVYHGYDSRGKKYVTAISTGLEQKDSALKFIDLSKHIHDIMYLLTGHRLQRGIQKYEPIHIDQTQDYRTKFARDLTPNEVEILEKDLDVLGEAISSMLDILNQEGATK